MKKLSFIPRVQVILYALLLNIAVENYVHSAYTRAISANEFVTMPFIVEPGSELSIEGTTNINSFACMCKETFPKNSFSMSLAHSNGIKTIRFNKTILKLRTESLKCDNSKIDSDLYDALDSETYPNIVVELLDAAVPEQFSPAHNESFTVQANASITITKITKNITLDVKAKKIGPNKYSFVASKELQMTDFGVTPPTALLGLIKVRDKIKINFNLIISL